MGDNFYLGDRNGVRTPMQWSPDRNAGFSVANPQQLFLPVIIDPEYHYESVNVENQQKNPSSLFWWMRRLLTVRRRMKAFSKGTIEFLHPDNAKVLVYLRKFDDEDILVVANLSRFAQIVEVDLSAYAGSVPEELFGRTRFPEIKSGSTAFTLGPHNFFWFALHPSHSVASGKPVWAPLELTNGPDWNAGLVKTLASQILPAYLPTCPWFGGDSRDVREVKIIHDIEVLKEPVVRLLIVETVPAEGLPVTYLLPLAILDADAARANVGDKPAARLAELGSTAVLCDALHVPAFREWLLRSIIDSRRLRTEEVKLSGNSKHSFEAGIWDEALAAARFVGQDESNTTLTFGDHWFLKFYRRFDRGPHPEIELTSKLDGGPGGELIPRFLGSLSLSDREGDGAVALLLEGVQNQGDAWTYTQDAIGRFCERVIAARNAAEDAGAAELLIGAVYPERARWLGHCTGELHLALAAVPEPEFEPEPFSVLHQRSVYQALRGAAGRVVREMRLKLPSLPEELRTDAARLMNSQEAIYAVYSRMLDHRLDSWKIRIHGDYHLGQVLNTGKGFVIVDFEGEPRRLLGERSLKRSPLVDLAGMLRSFDYAWCCELARQPEEDQPTLGGWSERWRTEVCASFLHGYFEVTGGSKLVPKDQTELRTLLNVFLLDKALYEVSYELAYRPQMLSVPLGAALELIDRGGELITTWLTHEPAHTESSGNEAAAGDSVSSPELA